MNRASWPFLKRVLALALVAFALAAALGGCSLGPLSTHANTTSTVVSGPAESSSTSTTKPPVRVTTSSTTSSTLRPSTTTASTAVRATTGDPLAIAKKLKPSVVGITAVRATTAAMIYESIGTGVIYSATTTYAYVITCNHVIQRADGTAAKRIRVTLSSGSTVSATVVGRNPALDIAVLRVKARKLTPAVFRTDLSDLAEGDFIVAIGNSTVLKHPAVSGTILGFVHDVEFPQLPSISVPRALDSSAPLEEGDSGGPLLDAQGRVVGIDMGKPIEGEGGISLPADLVVGEVKRLMAAAK